MIEKKLTKLGFFSFLFPISMYATINIHCSRDNGYIGCIRLAESTVNRTYELSGITHVTLFPKYGKHSTRPSTYGQWVRTYSKLFSCKPVLTVCSYRAQSNEIFTYREVSRGSVPRVRRYGLLYLRAVEYNQWQCVHRISLVIQLWTTRNSGGFITNNNQLCTLLIVAQCHHMASQLLVCIGSGNGLTQLAPRRS